MDNLMTRRRFFQTLAAAAVAAGGPLPIGFPKEGLVPLPPGNYAFNISGVTTGRWSSKGRIVEVTMNINGRVLKHHLLRI